MSDGTPGGIIRQIEALGYAVSVHAMGTYVEMHAVRLTGEGIPHVARCEGGDEESLYQCAIALAEMVGIGPNG
jgi:hypothetical protein